MISEVRGAIPATVAAVAWIVLAGALLYEDRASGRLMPFLLLAALPPAILAARAALDIYAHGDEEPSSEARWSIRLALSVAVALLLAPLCLVFIAGPGPALPAFPDSSVTKLFPGAGEAWAYVVALVLTIGAVVVPHGRALTTAAVILSATTIVSALGLVVNASWAGAFRLASASECAGAFAAPDSGSYATVAEGDLDGTWLGTVRGSGYDTRWGSGTVTLGTDDQAVRLALASTSLDSEARVTAEDLGIDLVSGLGPLRHCRTVIDGATAVRTFPALRRLVGANELTADPGRALEAWRGSLDWWLDTYVPVEATTPTTIWVLASVETDGQPPGWPFPGVHATLRATISFEPHG